MPKKKNAPPSGSAGRGKSTASQTAASKSSASKPTAKAPASSKAVSRTKREATKSEVGRTLQTRDEYFEGQRSYRKEGYETKGNYRKAVVIAQFNDDLALVKLTKGSSKGIPLEDEKVSKYKPYVETLDRNGEPIRYSGKFIPNKPSKALSKKDTAKIAIDCFKGDGELQKKNKNKVRKIKSRPPLK